jgi:lipopolysaccharide export system protein LptC
MKERFPALIALFLLIALVAGTCWAADYAQRAIPIDPPRRLTHEMDAWSRNFFMLRTDAQGQPINRLNGEYAEHFPDDDSYHITAPRAVGLQIGNPMTIATSRTAIVERSGERIIMNDDAYVHRLPDAKNEPLHVRSQQLILLPNEDVVYTAMPAEIIRGHSRLNGKGMRYNNKMVQLEVSAATEVEIAGNERRPRQPVDQPNSTSQRKYHD